MDPLKIKLSDIKNEYDYIENNSSIFISDNYRESLKILNEYSARIMAAIDLGYNDIKNEIIQADSQNISAVKEIYSLTKNLNSNLQTYYLGSNVSVLLEQLKTESNTEELLGFVTFSNQFMQDSLLFIGVWEMYANRYDIYLIENASLFGLDLVINQHKEYLNYIAS